MTPAQADFADLYDDLLRSRVVEHRHEDRLDLIATRSRHLLMLRLIDEHLVGRRRTIVDLGPGNGLLLRLASELGFERLIAVDREPWDHERSFLTDVPNVELIEGNFNRSGFLRELGDESADAAVATEVLEHVLDHPSGFLEECWRIVRPGGVLALTTPNPCTFANAARLVAGRPILWNDEWFARTPKLADGAVVSFPFVHYREYPPAVFRDLVIRLPGASLAAAGYVAHAPYPSTSVFKGALLSSIALLRLDHWRPLCHTQYALVQKNAD